jgi:hypothetical protein
MRRFKNPRASALALVALAFVLAGRATAQTGPVDPTRGNLFVLPVGVAQYDRPGNDLQWADQDARDYAAFWKSQKGRLFGHVYCHEPLLNKQGTRANILAAMKKLEDQVRPGDTVVASLCGHGTIDRRLGQWAFCAADYDPYTAAGSISAAELRTWVAGLTRKGARVVLLIDACFSGAADINLDGAAVLTSCQADETCLDGDPLALRNNGLFTQVLLKGLRGQADRNGDGVITLDEVVDYVARHVPELYRRVAGFSQGQQRPAAFRPGGTPTALPLAGVSATAVPSPIPSTGTGPIR